MTTREKTDSKSHPEVGETWAWLLRPRSFDGECRGLEVLIKAQRQTSVPQ